MTLECANAEEDKLKKITTMFQRIGAATENALSL
jgi:hypothetical protein